MFSRRRKSSTASSGGPMTNYSLDGNTFLGKLPSITALDLSANGYRPNSPASVYGHSASSSSSHSYAPYSPWGSPSFPYGNSVTAGSPMFSPASSYSSQSVSSRRSSVSERMDKKTAGKKYKRKLAGSEYCHVCAATETPEWRKGPSGSRTLCNACGLTHSKLTLSEPTTMQEVLKHLEAIGKARWRVAKYPLPSGTLERMAMSWLPPEDAASSLSASTSIVNRSRSSTNGNPRTSFADYEAAMNLEALSRSTKSSSSTPTAKSFSFNAPVYTYTPIASVPFPAAASPNLDKASRRLSAMSIDGSPVQSSSSSSAGSRMDISHLMNSRPSSRNSNRRMSFEGDTKSNINFFNF